MNETFNGLLSITIDDLLSWGPCCNNDELRRIAAARERWSALDIAMLDRPPADLLWVLLRPQLIYERMLHLLACDFAEHVLSLWIARYPVDYLTQQAIAVKRSWVAGEATDLELKTATEAARAAWARAVDASLVAVVVAVDASLAAISAAAAAAISVAWSAEQKWQLEHTIQVLEGK